MAISLPPPPKKEKKKKKKEALTEMKLKVEDLFMLIYSKTVY